MSTEARQQAVAYYMRQGAAVIPVPAGEKNPNRDGWQGLRLTPEDIPHHWTNGQNIGLLTGEPSGWRVDVDLDTDEAVEMAGRFLPPTLTSGRKSRPRSHWWYIAPGAKNAEWKDTDGKKLVELRSTGRQTVVAPSTHPDGDKYLWHSASGLKMVRIAAAELEEGLRELATAALVARHLPKHKEEGGGGRHDYGMALAGYLLRPGRLSEELVLKIFEAAWNAKGWLDERSKRDALHDLKGIVRDTAKKLEAKQRVRGGGALAEYEEKLPAAIAGIWDWRLGAGENPALWDDPVPLPEGLPPVRSFDFALLPESFRDWILDISERMQVPPDLLACGAMVVLSAVVGRKVGIYPKRYDDWKVIANLWGAVVGRPSLLKTPALQEILKPLSRLVLKANEDHQKALHEHKVEKLVYQAQAEFFREGMRDRARKAAKGGDRSDLDKWVREQKPEDEPEAPTEKRYRTEDATVEKLTELLLQNPNGLLVHRDELSGWLRNLDKQGREGDRAFFLEAWNGNGSFSVDRIARGSVYVPAVCLSILGGIQPGPLSRYVHDAVTGDKGDDGFLQRFQLLTWPDAPSTWKNVDRFPNHGAKNRAFEVFEALDEVDFREAEEEGDVPAFRFSPEAQDVFDTWRGDLEQRLRSEGMAPALEAHLAKYRSLMPSLALLVELADSVPEVPETVGEVSALRAEGWCEYLESHARRLYHSAERPEMAGARALLERIEKGDVKHRATIREVYRREFAQLATREQVRAALEVLEEFGWVRVLEAATGGRVSKKILVHPSLREKS